MKLDRSGVELRRIFEQLHRQNLFATDPFVDLVGDDPTRGEQLGEEFAVVDVSRSGRNLVGDLPSQRQQRSLPGGDVMVFRFRNHAVKIEKDGFQGHYGLSVVSGQLSVVSQRN